MPISVICECGKKASVPDAMAGRKGKCPACGSIIAIPSLVPDDVEDEIEEVEAGPLPARAQAARVAPSVSTVAAPIASKVRARCPCGRPFMLDPTVDNSKLACAGCGTRLGDRSLYFLYETTIQPVHLVDAELPFWSMFWLAFKWSCVVIPVGLMWAVLVWFILNFIAAMNRG